MQQIMHLPAQAATILDKLGAGMNKLLEELSQQARIQMASSERLEEYGQLIIAECLKAIEQTDRTHAYTTFDIGQINVTIERSKQSIKKHFDIK